MIAVGAIMLQQLINRSTLDLNVIRDRSPPFVRLADGSIRNDFELKVINMRAVTRSVAIEVTGLSGARLFGTAQEQEPLVVEARPDGVANVRLHVVAPPGTPAGSHNLRFRIVDAATGESAESASAFLAGDSR
jgi:polyferredoxin